MGKDFMSSHCVNNHAETLRHRQASWIRWLNPVYYGLEALFINEYAGRQFECSSFIPTGPSYADVSPEQRACSAVTSEPGATFIDGTAYIKSTYGCKRAALAFIKLTKSREYRFP